MATDKQIAANRANAQLSTGPSSDAGREAVSQNRTTHGLTGEFDPQTDAEIVEYKDLFDKFTNDFDPRTYTEFEFIAKMVEALIRSNRAVRLQDACVDTLAVDPDDPQARKDLELYLRYQASHDRAFQRYTAELRKFHTERKKAQIGFESQKRRELQDQRAQAQEIHRQNAETRRQQQHEGTVSLNQARLEYQLLKNRRLAAGEIAPERPPTHAPNELLAA